MRKLKLMGIIILILALLLFTFQNRTPVQIGLFAGYTVEVPLILVMLLCLLLGIALGIFIARNVGREKRPAATAAAAASTAAAATQTPTAADSNPRADSTRGKRKNKDKRRASGS